MLIDITSSSGKKAGNVEVSDTVFNRPFNESLVHQVVTAYLSGARQGTHAQKTRAEVRGGGKKPWKQKGTGRARAGTIRSPLWRKGGVTFAARPQDYSQKVNKKMYRGAMCTILSELIRQGRLIVVDEFEVNSFKTKDLLQQLKSLDLQKGMIVLHEVNEKFYLASRNVPGLVVCDAEGVDPVSLVRHSKVFMTVNAVKQIGERLA